MSLSLSLPSYTAECLTVCYSSRGFSVRFGSCGPCLTNKSSFFSKITSVLHELHLQLHSFSNLNVSLEQLLPLCIYSPVLFQVSLEAVRSLGLLLEGSAGHGKPVRPIHRLLTKAPLQTQAGYSLLSSSFTLHKLLSCLQHSLTLNPFGITACLRSGKKLAWAQQGAWASSDSVPACEQVLERLLVVCDSSGRDHEESQSIQEHPHGSARQ